MFAEQPSNYALPQVPYRARYKAPFDGSQSQLSDRLLSLLKQLEANLVDENLVDEVIRLNPLENRYELAAVLNEDLEFSLLAYWPSDSQMPIEVTFDLDSPVPIELPVDDQFLNSAKHYFPKIRLIYNFLNRPKVTVSRSENQPGLRRNQAWIKDHRQEYKGKWVALRDGELLANANSADELLQQMHSTENTLLTVIY